MSGPPSIQAPPEDGAPTSSDSGGQSSSAGGTPASSAGSETAPSLHADVAAGGRDHHAPTKWLAMLTAGFLTLLVMGVLFPNLWYGMHDITDLPVYWGYAARIAQGEAPFTPSFQVEYPPLAVALFRVPGHTGSESLYGIWFNILMGAITIATGVVTAYVACRLWPRGGRAYVAAVLFPVGVALIGTIVINRYDVAVALLIAIFLLCLVGRWYTAAGFVLGMGFALKLTPLALLPLVLLLAGPPRRWAWPLVAFGAAAVAPFLPYLVNGTSGLWHVFQYHLERPLQIESVLGTPQLLGQLLGADWATWAWSHGSHSLVAPGVGLAADLSGGLTLLAVAAVYLFAWLRRRHLRAAPADLALVVLALLLALMTFGKVLSPQYFIWILPAWALVAAKDRWIAVLGGLTLALTQAEFPARYWFLLDMEPTTLAIVVARNTLLLATFAVALWRVWRLPEAASRRPAWSQSRSRRPARLLRRCSEASSDVAATTRSVVLPDSPDDTSHVVRVADDETDDLVRDVRCLIVRDESQQAILATRLGLENAQGLGDPRPGEPRQHD